MIELYVLDVEEFRPIAEHTGKTTTLVGDYLEIVSNETVVINRKTAGVRISVWYSAISALRGGRVTQYDRDALRIEPTGSV